PNDGPTRAHCWFVVTSLSAALDQTPVIGILRSCPLQFVGAMATVAEEAGLTVLEITLDSARPFETIKTLAEDHPGLLLGAGTVRSARDVVRAAEAQAQFVVSPHFDPDVIAAASEVGIPSVPGAATPTEICRAMAAGAELVKVFPARELGGPAYVKAILGPLGRPALLPTGGVDVTNAAAFLEAGSAAIGVGGGIFPAGALESGDVTEVERLCRQLFAAIR
ncbi:MAG: bifunctional 4-hydroxy-2-oxoglutarate aldolase/2-dehydro-3-deoxy-phosphogluconate aldolase, partial [Acidimicrobiales bacterium]